MRSATNVRRRSAWAWRARAFAFGLAALVAMFHGGEANAAPPNRVDVIIAFDRTPGPAERAIVETAGGDIRHSYTIVPAVAASLPEAAVDALRRNPRISAIEPDGEAIALDAELDATWGVSRIGAGTVHASQNAGAGVRIAVIDTGIDYGHPELDGNYAHDLDRDFVDNDLDAMDEHGHGTHVAGTACAEDNGFGVVGVAPACTLVGVRVLDENASGSWSDIVAGLEWAAANADVANLSLGSRTDPGTTVRQAFDNAAASGLVIVAAAGNSGRFNGKGDNVEYPARYQSVIAVAATDANDNRGSFSSTGSAVELSAPGVAVFSTWNDGDSATSPQPTCSSSNGCYKIASGTSMAAPHVAGVAALVIAAGNATNPAEVRAALQSTATDLGVSGRDPLYGYGLVNAAGAVGYSPPSGGDGGGGDGGSDGGGSQPGVCSKRPTHPACR